MPKRIQEKQVLSYELVQNFVPRGKPYEIFDKEVGGFSVQVYPTGNRTYFVNYNLSGKRKRLRIGDPNLLEISKAREIAIRIKQAAKIGRNPKFVRDQAAKAEVALWADA